MPRRSPDVVTISSPSDVICAVAQVLGFTPTESVVAVCTHGRRCRFGLAMRFDLDLASEIAPFVAAIDTRTRHENPDGVFIIVFADALPGGGDLPYRDLIARLTDRLGGLVLDVLLVAGHRWWSYLCDEPRCCGPDGTPIDPHSAGATALTAAYALAGQGALPDRDAVVRSIAYDGRAATAMAERIAEALRDQAEQRQPARRRAVRALVERLTTELVDPRAGVSDHDAAELVAFCHDVIVRDEVLVGAVKPRGREVLLRVLRDVVRRIPPPLDAPICATLAWVAYASGDGALANVALDRALSTDPDYSLALLIADSLRRQVPPGVLEEVMREAGRDLRGRSAAG
jgi:hypothetical protein